MFWTINKNHPSETFVDYVRLNKNWWNHLVFSEHIDVTRCQDICTKYKEIVYKIKIKTDIGLN